MDRSTDERRRRRRIVSLVSAFGLVASILAPAAQASGPLEVTIDSGSLAGITMSGVDEWRGIPYAVPPVGALRWRPPQPVTPWSGTRDASQFGAHCIQLDFPTGVLGSEDCLYLNVYRPAGTSASAHLPVMVHLHPGGNAVGWGYEDATALVERGVIVVTLNYRLGVFGFVGHPALTAEGSLPEQGGLDQIAALRWVQRNIAAFGGDSNSVTLFGMSAGSFDTVVLAASPLARGLFHRIAVEGIAYWPLTSERASLADSEDVGNFVADALGCSGAGVATCLRSLPAADIVEAAGRLDIGIPVGGTILPRSALVEISQNGSVPMLIGSNREEAGFFFAPLPANLSQGEISRDASELLTPQKASKILKLYPQASYDSREWAYITTLTDAVYSCPTRRLALASAAHGPTWRYLYTHVMQNDPEQTAYRAGHSFEDPFIWRHFYPLLSGAPYVPTAAEDALSATMTGYWTNFAKNGDPNGPGLPDWPRYTSASERYQVLDDTVAPAAKYHVEQCALIDTVVPYSYEGSLFHYYVQAQWWHKFRE